VISFRYHVFTVVAIFLAVALGIAIGNTGLSRSLVVRSLERQTEQLQRELDETRARQAAVSARVEQYEQASDVLPVLVDGDLAGMRVVIVTHVGVDDEILAQTRRALDAADAELVTALAVTERMAALEQDDRDELAEVLRLSPGEEPDRLVERALEVVSARLAGGPPRRDPNPGDGDVLGGLLRREFLMLADGAPQLSETALADLGGNGEIVVVAAGGDEEPVPSVQEFLVPFVERLVASGATVAAAESAGTAFPFVGYLRGDEDTTGRIVTVDDLDLPIGGAALVLGLERLVLLGQGGDYGFKGADVRAIPPP
jgi:hypothetical protein